MVEEMVSEPIRDAVEPTARVDLEECEPVSAIDRDRLWAQLMFGVRIGVDIDTAPDSKRPAAPP